MKIDFSLTVSDLYYGFRSFISRNLVHIIKHSLLLLAAIGMGIALGIKETTVEEYSNYLIRAAKGDCIPFIRAVLIMLLYSSVCIPFLIPKISSIALYCGSAIIYLNGFIFGIQFGAVICESSVSGYLLFLFVLLPVCLFLSFYAILFVILNSCNLPCQPCSRPRYIMLYLASVGLTAILFYMIVLKMLYVFVAT